MDLTTSEKRLFVAEEDRREAAESGAPVDCVACDSEAGDDAVVLLGVTYCVDCGADEAFRLRGDGDEWTALSRADQVEALEIIESQARAERMQLVKKGGRS